MNFEYQNTHTILYAILVGSYYSCCIPIASILNKTHGYCQHLFRQLPKSSATSHIQIVFIIWSRRIYTPTNEVNIGNRQVVSYRGMQALFNGQSKNMVVHILRCEGSSSFWFKYTPTIDLRRQLDDQQIKPQICINFQDMIFFIYKLLFSKDRINNMLPFG